MEDKFFSPRNSSWYAMNHTEEGTCSLHCIDMISYHSSVVCWLVAHINYFFFPLYVVIGWWCTVIGWLGFVVSYDWQKTTRSGAWRPVQAAFYYSWILPGVYYESHRPSEGQGKLGTNSHGSGKWDVVCCVVCEKCIIEKYVFQKLFYKALLYWDLASEVWCLLFYCTSRWMDLSDFLSKPLVFLQEWISLPFCVLSHIIYLDIII